ncbi:glycosyltransferase family 2 protein [Bacillus sp. ISL-18]|uniref:glycosyltransferase family 2 protein n=1 Tax=Bacillus sp. ISL-18 TaxID=2819118 RepID=UPI001BE94167|nr:glycosyltransferase family 2 protein [Bacillus sp. ISL-18]MBT2658627.1 glycosyltransferase family 2 protein [Bacillus sp. ISL-18]
MIDIIIPIYDGYEETKECIESVLECKNNLENRIILINDRSPNDKISQLLKSFSQNNVILLTNEENLGFVKTVNKGMKYSQNDVILLNSDTVVTNYWIDKLYKAAYSSEKVGTVTALTNNGTIASVPFFNQDNVLPAGYSINEFSNLVERVSEDEYPVIPTAVGHALFIKRSVLNKVGYFDEENFGKGYGEEEDFSCRVIKKGYQNILADNTFIYHYGSTSFKSDKAAYIKNNKKILRKKHWWHPFNVKLFLYFNKDVKNICNKIQREIGER